MLRILKYFLGINFWHFSYDWLLNTDDLYSFICWRWFDNSKLLFWSMSLSLSLSPTNPNFTNFNRGSHPIYWTNSKRHQIIFLNIPKGHQSMKLGRWGRRSMVLRWYLTMRLCDNEKLHRTIKNDLKRPHRLSTTPKNYLNLIMLFHMIFKILGTNWKYHLWSSLHFIGWEPLFIFLTNFIPAL